MAMTVVGLYDDETTARKAATSLRDNGFKDAWIHIEAHGADETTSRRDGNLVGTLTSVGVPNDEAQFYAEGVRRGGSLLILEAPEDRADRAAELMNVHKPITRREREADWRERGGYTSDEAERERTRSRTGMGGREERIQEGKEELHVGKREVESGGVRLHKRVKERPVEETVNLREEEVDVERRRASRTTPSDGDMFEEKTIEMRERREEPVVEKETKVTGEVVARKQSREHAETIRDTVRETEVDVERIGQREDYLENRDTFREHYDTTFGSRKGSYRDYEPAYQFGYAYGSHDRFSDYDYRDVEPELRRGYEERYGNGTFESVKDAIRHGYTRAQSYTTT